MSEQSNGPRRPFKDSSGPRRSFGAKPHSGKPYAGSSSDRGSHQQSEFKAQITRYDANGKKLPSLPARKPAYPSKFPSKYPSKFGASNSRFAPAGRTPLPHNIDERQRTTSWNDVAQWYDEHLAGDDTYHTQVVLPNLIRLVNPRPGMRIVELGSGQGFFCREFAKKGSIAIGVEMSEKLVEIARTKAREENVQDKATFVVSAAEKADVIKTGETDAVLVVLALQNMHFIDDISAQISRILKDKGHAYIVLNHPMFRMPKQSSWGYDQLAGKQYRRIDRYMSELEAKIDMRPGLSAQAGETVAETISFHRPLSAYVTAFAKKGLAIVGMEEWISHKESQEGPRKAAEDTARKEIPLFMCLVLGKISKE